VRCPRCGGLETKRHGTSGAAPTGLAGPGRGLQRFFCHACRRTFTFARRTAQPRAQFDDEVQLEAVRLYVQGLTSYRTLATLMEHRLGRPVSRITLNRWVDQTGERAMTPLQMSVALSPTWGGYLGVDGKAVFIKGIEHALLIAVDQTTQDVVHARLVKAETIEGFYRLVREAVVVAGYPLSGLIIDASSSFVIAHSHYLARLPLQLCRIHFCRNLDYEIAKAKRAPDAWLRAELKQRIRATLFASTYLEARHRLQTLLADAAHYQGLSRHDTLGQLEKRFELLMTHHHHPGLPPDSNITENVIKQLGKKLRLMEGFQTVETAQRFVRLLVACYRFKRFTDSGNGHNGTAPLELAGVNLTGLDWLHYLQQNPPREQHSM